MKIILPKGSRPSAYTDLPPPSVLVMLWEGMIRYVVGVLQTGGHLRITPLVIGNPCGVLNSKQVISNELMRALLNTHVGNRQGNEFILYKNCEKLLKGV